MSASTLIACRLQDVEELVPCSPGVRGTRAFRFSWPEGSFDFKPGQWLDLALGSGDKTVLGGYSFSSSPLDRSGFELTIRENPDHPVTEKLWRSSTGLEVFVSSGQGRCFLDVEQAQPTLLIAGGIGLAPLLSMLRTLAHASEAARKEPFALIHAAKSAKQLIRRREFEDLSARDSRFRYQPHLSDKGRLGEGPLSRELGLLSGQDPGKVQAFVCGPGSMNRDVARLLEKLGVDRSRIGSEAWW